MAEPIKVPKLNKEQIQLIFAVVFCSGALFFVYWKYFLAPTSSRITEASKKLESVERDIKSAESQEKRLDKLKVEVANLKEQRNNAEKRLPKGRNMPDLIYTLNDMARKYNVEVNSISPQGKSPKQYFTEVYYGISLNGTYHSLGKFLTALGVSERIFSTKGLTISAASSGVNTVSATFMLVTYQYNG